MNLFGLIKTLRIENKLTQSDLASHLKITKQAYSRYENGTRSISIDVLGKIVNYYQMSLGDVFKSDMSQLLTNEPNEYNSNKSLEYYARFYDYYFEKTQNFYRLYRNAMKYEYKLAQIENREKTIPNSAKIIKLKYEEHDKKLTKFKVFIKERLKEKIIRN